MNTPEELPARLLNNIRRPWPKLLAALSTSGAEEYNFIVIDHTRAYPGKPIETGQKEAGPTNEP